MAGDNRGSSSLFRRAEQLRRWQESETNRQDLVEKPKKVKFSDGCIFLAAGAAGDKEELKRLLDRGADINTVNQDGITALHAACIDNNLEIVEFLVDNNADINRCDMEGWTPLHATASCGSLYMAEFLISRGADLSVVNNDGELAIDVVDEAEMEKLLQQEMDRRGIDCDASRSREERHMVEDAQSWLNSGQILDIPHHKTGATALHVAAAKGYIKVMRLLIDAGSSINTKDFDGWTPLHAAAHWGQTEAVEILCDSMADMDTLNSVGQTPYDLADDTIKPLMDELRRKQASTKLINQKIIMSKKRKPSPHKDRSNKKEKEAQKRDSDGTSSDESSSEHDVERGSSGGRVESSVDQSEVQSWRRASARSKVPLGGGEEKSSTKDEVSKSSSAGSSPHLNHKEGKESEVPLRKDSCAKEERNCQDVLRLSESTNHVTTPASTTPTSSTTPSTTSSSPTRHVNRSFAPPSRDDESETQRKAHAKMVRSTRRSTQGITLEDLKSAEQYIKNKATTSAPSTPPTTTSSLSTSSSTTTTASTTTTNSTSSAVSSSSHHPNASATIEVISATNAPVSSTSSPSSVAETTATNTASNQDSSFSLDASPRPKAKERAEPDAQVTNVTLPLRKKSIVDDKKDDKSEADKSASSTREGTQAVIQRRKKAKRRSTGVVHVDLDEIDPDRKLERKEDEDEGSVSDRESSSTKSSSSVHSSSKSSSRGSTGGHNGDIDYKKLYEEQLCENDKLMLRLREHERDLRVAKETIDSNGKTSSARSAVAESERREKRALERKLSEMEEELRQMQKLKSENEKLRAENRALTRVVSKLTNSAAGSMGGQFSSAFGRPK